MAKKNTIPQTAAVDVAPAPQPAPPSPVPSSLPLPSTLRVLAPKPKTVGSRQEVYDGLALRTGGRLTKNDLINDNGVIKSKRRSELARNVALERFAAPKPGTVEQAVRKIEKITIPSSIQEEALEVCKEKPKRGKKASAKA